MKLRGKEILPGLVSAEASINAIIGGAFILMFRRGIP